MDRGSMYNKWGCAKLEMKSQHRSSRTPTDLKMRITVELGDNVTREELMGAQERHDTAIPSCLGLLNVVLSRILRERTK
jgi:hypothetical protein